MHGECLRFRLKFLLTSLLSFRICLLRTPVCGLMQPRSCSESVFRGVVVLSGPTAYRARVSTESLRLPGSSLGHHHGNPACRRLPRVTMLSCIFRRRLLEWKTLCQ